MSKCLSQTCNFIWQGHSNVAICMSVLFPMDAISVNFAEAMRCSWAIRDKDSNDEKNQSLKASGPNWMYAFHHEIIIYSFETLQWTNILWTDIHWTLRQRRPTVSSCTIFLSSTRVGIFVLFIHHSQGFRTVPGT